MCVADDGAPQGQLEYKSTSNTSEYTAAFIHNRSLAQYSVGLLACK
jgi:hypothetical protein